MHEGLSVLRNSHAFRQPGNTSQVIGDRLRWRADEKDQVHRWSISTERHSRLASPNYQEKPGDRFGPRVRKRDMIRSRRGNCRLARADTLDEQLGIHNRRMSADDRSESSQALIEGGRPHIHQDTARIHDPLEFLRCHRVAIYLGPRTVTRSFLTPPELRSARGESSSFIRKILHRVAWGEHSPRRILACNWPASPPNNTSGTGGQHCRRGLAIIMVTSSKPTLTSCPTRRKGTTTGTGMLPTPSFFRSPPAYYFGEHIRLGESPCVIGWRPRRTTPPRTRL